MANDLKTILQPLEEELKKVDEDIKLKLTTGIDVLDNSALHLFSRGGKKIRASLVLLTSGLKDDSIPDGIIEMAAAAEIVHAATLIHDDIIDQAYLRRGDVTVSKKFGDKAAVLAGDYMYTIALSAAVDDGDSDLFPIMVFGTRDMVKGELYQLQYSNIELINEEHYYNIIELKTARFMATCTELGAKKGGFSSEQCKLLRRFGLVLGYAFQIIDDTLDVIEKDDKTGKDSGNDFIDGKVTLPFLYLLEKSNETERAELKKYASNPDRENWQIVRERLEKSGAIEYSLNVAEKYINEGLEIIGQFPDTKFRRILTELSNFIIDRDF